jgi:hypothetical protein
MTDQALLWHCSANCRRTQRQVLDFVAFPERSLSPCPGRSTRTPLATIRSLACGATARFDR